MCLSVDDLIHACMWVVSYGMFPAAQTSNGVSLTASSRALSQAVGPPLLAALGAVSAAWGRCSSLLLVLLSNAYFSHNGVTCLNNLALASLFFFFFFGKAGILHEKELLALVLLSLQGSELSHLNHAS